MGRTKENASTGWASLPYYIIIRIFLKLQEPEMVHAASVCTRWRQVFYEPCFWRSVVFDLNFVSRSTAEVAKKLQNHLLTIGSSVEHLTIICPEKSWFVQSHLTDCVKAILDTLASIKTTIRTFQIKQIKMVQNWQLFDCRKCDIIHALCNFIESQTCLQTLVISEALLPTTFGHMVMSSLARSHSVDTLQQLDIFYLYAFYSNVNMQHGELILSSLKKCHNLVELTVNYGLMYALTVEKLFESVAHSLKQAHLIFHKMNFNTHQIPDLIDDYGHDLDDTDEDNDEDYFADNNDDIHYNYLEVNNEEDMSYELSDLYEDKELDMLPPPVSPERWSHVTQVCPGLKVSVDFHTDKNVLVQHLNPSIPISQLTVRGIDAMYDAYDGINNILKYVTECSFGNLESVTFIGCRELVPHRRMIQTAKDNVVNFFLKYPNIRSFQVSPDLMDGNLLQSVKSELLDRFGIEQDVLSFV